MANTTGTSSPQRAGGQTHRRGWLAAVVVVAAVAVGILVWVLSKGASDGGSGLIPGSATDIEVSFVGDVPSSESLASENSDTDYSELFAHLGDAIGSSDVRVLTQDSALPAPRTEGSDTSSAAATAAASEQKAATSLRDAEVSAGFDVILKATDHIFDNGYGGLGAEMDYWKNSHPDVRVLGADNPNLADRDQDLVDNVYVYEKGGFKVAFLCYTYGTQASGGAADEKYVSTLSKTKIERDVLRAQKAGADMIIACPFWGQEYSSTLTDEETSFADVFASAGVDVVVGTTPHSLQEEETITTSSGHKTICLYSLGDLISTGSNEQSYVGGLAQVRLHKDADGSCSVTSVTVKPLITYRDGTGSGSAPTAYLVQDYTDALAASNLDGTLTTSYVTKLCQGLFGSAYDPKRDTYTVSQ